MIESKTWVIIGLVAIVITSSAALILLSQSSGLGVTVCFTTSNGMTVVIQNNGSSTGMIESYSFSNSTFRYLRTGPITIPSGLSFSDTVNGNFTASKYDFVFTLSSGMTTRFNVECLQGVSK